MRAGSGGVSVLRLGHGAHRTAAPHALHRLNQLGAAASAEPRPPPAREGVEDTGRRPLNTVTATLPSAPSRERSDNNPCRCRRQYLAALTHRPVCSIAWKQFQGCQPSLGEKRYCLEIGAAAFRPVYRSLAECAPSAGCGKLRAEPPRCVGIPPRITVRVNPQSRLLERASKVTSARDSAGSTSSRAERAART